MANVSSGPATAGPLNSGAQGVPMPTLSRKLAPSRGGSNLKKLEDIILSQITPKGWGREEVEAFLGIFHAPLWRKIIEKSLKARREAGWEVVNSVFTTRNALSTRREMGWNFVHGEILLNRATAELLRDGRDSLILYLFRLRGGRFWTFYQSSSAEEAIQHLEAEKEADEAEDEYEYELMRADEDALDNGAMLNSPAWDL